MSFTKKANGKERIKLSVFYCSKTDYLKIRCNGCGLVKKLYKGETDRLLANNWIRENKWQTRKMFDKWIHLCPKCKEALLELKRADFLKKVKGE